MLAARRIIHVKTDEVVTIAPLGDIQWTGREEDIAVDLFAEHLTRCLDLNAYYLGLGDYIDFMSPSNRTRLRNADLYDNAQKCIMDKARALTDELYDDFLVDTTGQWLGMVSGHHYCQLEGTETTDTYLAKKLKSPHTEALLYFQLVIQHEHRQGELNFWVHHTSGGGTAGAIENRLRKQFGHWPVDFLLAGHTTSRLAKPIPRMDVYWTDGVPKIVDRPVWLISCGGWSKAYRLGETDYVERAAMAPVSLGAPLITIIPQWAGKHFTPTVRVEA